MDSISYDVTLVNKLSTTCSYALLQQWDSKDSGSEPLLAEAAWQFMHDSLGTLVCHLAKHSNLHCINCEWCGKLVTVLLVMQAHDSVAMAT